MFNLITRRSVDALSPFKTMMGSHFDKMFEEFDRFFEDPFFRDSNLVLNSRGTADFPKVDILEEDGKFVLSAAVAGIPKEDISIEYDSDNHILTLASRITTKKETDNKRYLSREISKRSFLRRFPFDGTVEGEPKAELKDGILTVTLNKAKKIEEKKNSIKNIEIK